MRPFAALFPGQGSQHSGMGKDLASGEPAAAAIFRAADDTLGMPLTSLCFSGPDSELMRTEITQPSILTVSIAALRAYAARGGEPPAAAAGHSLGEYAAHVAAGTITFEEAVAAVRERGRFMQEAVPEGAGAMAAILGLDRTAVEDACLRSARGEIVSLANINGPGQIVIAGHRAAVAWASEAAIAAGAKRVVPLPVSAPFHCALMEPAAQRLARRLDALAFCDPAVPVYTNVDAAPVATAEASRDALVRQVASPVRWEEEVLQMAEDGIDTFVEFGPGRVLTGLVRRIVKDARVFAVSDLAGVLSAIHELGA